jgi:hypothetical protein
MRVVAAAAAVLAAGVITFLVLETARLAELAGRYEVEARAARRAARPDVPAVPAATVTTPPSAAAGATPPPAAEAAQDAVAYARLALELATTQERLAAVTALLEQRNQENAARAAAAAADAERRSRPMPEGVRQCLFALHECLRAEGFTAPRFLRAAALGPDGLLDVEMLQADPSGVDVAVVHAARVTATLDRARGRLELRFFDGQRIVDGSPQRLPDDGFVLAFDDVDGRRLEARLPYLLRSEGVYPEPAAPPARPATDVDPIGRRHWLERFDALLAASGTKPAWRVTRFRGLDGGWFLAADLVGTDERHHVVASAHCARLAVEVDERAEVVSLLLLDGSLRRGGRDSTITGEGYRVLLPDVTCKQATDAMLGMVVRK